MLIVSKMERKEAEKAMKILENYDHALFTGDYDLAEEIENSYKGTDLEKRIRAIKDDHTKVQM